MEKIVVVRKFKTPDGTILRSQLTHDFSSHKDKNGEYYFIDGGSDYLRMSVNTEPMEDISIYEDDSIEIIREEYTRGTFNEKGQRIRKKISEMSNKHLENCITYNINIGFGEDCLANRIYKRELKYRKENNITITDDWLENNINLN